MLLVQLDGIFVAHEVDDDADRLEELFDLARVAMVAAGIEVINRATRHPGPASHKEDPGSRPPHRSPNRPTPASSPLPPRRTSVATSRRPRAGATASCRAPRRAPLATAERLPAPAAASSTCPASATCHWSAHVNGSQ
ncbi:MAG: hypothetical protein M5U19_05495 [Microthrixaceae bacterium]|nr:hypothetical protein [Microthrixaceae bacterium]